MGRGLYGRLSSRNPVPSRYETREDGERTNDIPNESIIGGPSFRSSQDDDLLQMAGLIADALLKQGEEPSQRVKELRACTWSSGSSTAMRRGENP